MNKEQAKIIHSVVINVLMHTQGIGEMTSTDFQSVKDISLPDMIEANHIMDGYKEITETGFRGTVTTTVIALAELYLRIHDKEFMMASEFEEICRAMDSNSENTVNGHGVLIDGSGYYSLIELNSAGDSAEKTLITLGTPEELHDYAKKFIAIVEADTEITD